jgi:hypothetical protein
MCCWVQDRQAGDDNRNCEEPYEENCVNEDPMDNVDICAVDMGRSPESNRVSKTALPVSLTSKRETPIATGLPAATLSLMPTLSSGVPTYSLFRPLIIWSSVATSRMSPVPRCVLASNRCRLSPELTALKLISSREQCLSKTQAKSLSLLKRSMLLNSSLVRALMGTQRLGILLRAPC